MCTIENSIREMKNRHLPQIFRKKLERNPKHVHTQHWNIFERLCPETFSPIRELATRDLLDKSIVSHLWGVLIES